MSDAVPTSPDQLANAPHPAHTAQIYGHDAAQTLFEQAFAQGRMHHAWLITGEKGIGKASFAYQCAAFLLQQSQQDPALSARIYAHSEPNLIRLLPLLNDKTKKYATTISIEAVRALKHTLSLRITDASWRVVLIDSIDLCTDAAMNALLKALEEPSERVVFLLISHDPGRLLPTIRSRCRHLPLSALDVSDFTKALMAATQETDFSLSNAQIQELALLSNGAPGQALRFAQPQLFGIYDTLFQALNPKRSLPRDRIMQWQSCAMDKKTPDFAESFAHLTRIATYRFAITLSSLKGDAPLGIPLRDSEQTAYERFAQATHPHKIAVAFAQATQKIEMLTGQTLRLNLDPSLMILDICHQIEIACQGKSDVC